MDRDHLRLVTPDYVPAEETARPGIVSRVATKVGSIVSPRKITTPSPHEQRIGEIREEYYRVLDEYAETGDVSVLDVTPVDEKEV